MEEEEEEEEEESTVEKMLGESVIGHVLGNEEPLIAVAAVTD